MDSLASKELNFGQQNAAVQQNDRNAKPSIVSGSKHTQGNLLDKRGLVNVSHNLNNEPAYDGGGTDRWVEPNGAASLLLLLVLLCLWVLTKEL